MYTYSMVATKRGRARISNRARILSQKSFSFSIPARAPESSRLGTFYRVNHSWRCALTVCVGRSAVGIAIYG